MSERVFWSYDEVPEKLSAYIEYKLQVLKQMCIKLTKSEKAHMRQLQSIIQVDNYAHSLIMSRL